MFFCCGEEEVIYIYNAVGYVDAVVRWRGMLIYFV